MTTSTTTPPHQGTASPRVCMPRRYRDMLLAALDVYREECGGSDDLRETRRWVEAHSVDNKGVSE